MPREKRYTQRTISLPAEDDDELGVVSKQMGLDRSSLLRLFYKEGLRRLRSGELKFGLTSDGKFE